MTKSKKKGKKKQSKNEAKKLKTNSLTPENSEDKVVSGEEEKLTEQDEEAAHKTSCDEDVTTSPHPGSTNKQGKTFLGKLMIAVLTLLLIVSLIAIGVSAVSLYNSNRRLEMKQALESIENQYTELGDATSNYFKTTRELSFYQLNGTDEDLEALARLEQNIIDLENKHLQLKEQFSTLSYQELQPVAESLKSYSDSYEEYLMFIRDTRSSYELFLNIVQFVDQAQGELQLNNLSMKDNKVEQIEMIVEKLRSSTVDGDLLPDNTATTQLVELAVERAQVTIRYGNSVQNTIASGDFSALFSIEQDYLIKLEDSTMKILKEFSVLHTREKELIELLEKDEESIQSAYSSVQPELHP
ncbi:MAG: hypothetical protein ACOCXT_04700 [Candidatus Dojkabacteria bacterium]